MNGWSSDHDRAIGLASRSIEAFCQLFLYRAFWAKTPDFHRAILNDLQDRSIKKLGIIAPRGHSKSTVVSVAFPMWETIFRPPQEDLFGIIISESQDQAKNFLHIMKHNFSRNQDILNVFGSLEGEKWTEDEIRTSNGCRWVAKGTGQRVRGMLSGEETITRPNIIILDDFESETNSATPDAIDKNIKWLTKAVEPSLSDDGRLIAVGTIISQRSYLSKLREDPSWKVHFYQAIMGNKPIWPERFSMQRLMDIRRSYESRGRLDSFYQEYQNVPINMEDQDFKPQYIKHYDGELVLAEGIQPCMRFRGGHPAKPGWYKEGMSVPVTVGIGVDLAISEDHKADWTVVMPLAMDQDENRFVLPYRRIKTGDIDNITSTILDVAMTNGASYVHFETVQFQQAVANQFRKRMIEAEVYFGIHETSPRTSKDSRIRSLQPLYSRGLFFHPIGMAEELTAELLNYPSPAHDDCLDGLWYANYGLYPPELKPFMGEMPERQEREEMEWIVL